MMCKEGYHTFDEFKEWAEAQEVDDTDPAVAGADGFMMNAQG